MISPVAIAAPEPLPHRNLATRLAERFHFWRERRRWVGEMADAAALGRIDDILDDVGLTRSELNVLIAAPADAGRQFETFAAMAQVDLRQLSPAALRDATWQCAKCACRVPCKRWLRGGAWNYDGDPRCPNAALLRH